MYFCELIFLCTDSDDEEEDEDVKTAFKPQVILEPKVDFIVKLFQVSNIPILSLKGYWHC